MISKQNKSTRAKSHPKRDPHICPICCIIPPHMTDHIIKHGDDEMRTWAMNTMRTSEQFRGRREVIGNLSLADSTGQKRRTIYDARQGETLPGRLVRGEGGRKSRDVAVNEAYDGAGATYDLYHDVFERNSIDDR